MVDRKTIANQIRCTTKQFAIGLILAISFLMVNTSYAKDQSPTIGANWFREGQNLFRVDLYTVDTDLLEDISTVSIAGFPDPLTDSSSDDSGIGIEIGIKRFLDNQMQLFKQTHQPLIIFPFLLIDFQYWGGIDTFESFASRDNRQTFGSRDLMGWAAGFGVGLNIITPDKPWSVDIAAGAELQENTIDFSRITTVTGTLFDATKLSKSHASVQPFLDLNGTYEFTIGDGARPVQIGFGIRFSEMEAKDPVQPGTFSDSSTEYRFFVGFRF